MSLVYTAHFSKDNANKVDITGIIEVYFSKKMQGGKE